LLFDTSTDALCAELTEFKGQIICVELINIAGLVTPRTLQTKESDSKKPEPVMVTTAPDIGPEDGNSDKTCSCPGKYVMLMNIMWL
jgi:hypothetical protein